MTPDTSRWRSSPEYDYVDDLVAPDLAWEWLRRNDNYQRDYAERESSAADPALVEEAVRRWGLEFFRSAVTDGPADSHLLVG